ncbi:hypothetical protein SADUNF_Sadunf02G0006500 [Salix dunnii]|uniref:Uncharacterized protein n=1 Tax=Salix dunnii TaxID=1413687 RepID=A0A835N5D9_9ROSI|nr:hypothetical protein SADUNF_Sadunf02G0006500 [Salix dunnii]
MMDRWKEIRSRPHAIVSARVSLWIGCEEAIQFQHAPSSFSRGVQCRYDAIIPLYSILVSSFADKFIANAHVPVYLFMEKLSE